MQRYETENPPSASATGVAHRERRTAQVEYRAFKDITPEQLAGLLGEKLETDPEDEHSQSMAGELWAIVLNEIVPSDEPYRRSRLTAPWLLGNQPEEGFGLDETVVIIDPSTSHKLTFVNKILMGRSLDYAEVSKGGVSVHRLHPDSVSVEVREAGNKASQRLAKEARRLMKTL